MSQHATGAGDYGRQLFLFLAALFQVGASAAPFLFDLGATIGERSDALETPIIPAGYAFSIWSVIFAWSIALSVYALLPRVARSDLMRRISWPLGGAFIANGVWSIYAPMINIDWLSLIIIITGLTLALNALARLRNGDPLSALEAWIAQPAVALTAGWLTAATFVGASSVMVLAGVNVGTPILLGLLAGAVVLSSLIAVTIGGWIYAAPVIWALAAVIVKNADGGDRTILMAAATGIAVLLGALFVARRRA